MSNDGIKRPVHLAWLERLALPVITGVFTAGMVYASLNAQISSLAKSVTDLTAVVEAQQKRLGSLEMTATHQDGVNDRQDRSLGDITTTLRIQTDLLTKIGQDVAVLRSQVDGRGH
jgi:hypothetical protein